MKLAALLSGALSALVLLLTAHSAAAAPANMSLVQACRLDNLVDVGFRWRGNSTSASMLFLDVSFVDNGWAKGTFSSVGPIDPSISSTAAGGFIQNKTYFARVNQRMSDGTWQASPTYQFSAVDCADPANWLKSSSSSSSSSSNYVPKVGPKPQPDPLLVPQTSESDSTPPQSSSAGDSSSTICADGATVYGGGDAACANHGGIAR
jgi:hypothetical protein